MIRKFLVVAGMAISFSSYAQVDLVVPAGKSLLLENAVVPMGVSTEAGPEDPILNFGVNFRGGGAPKATEASGAFRVDMRPTYPMFQWISRAADTSKENVVMTVSQGGNLNVGGEFINIQQENQPAGIRFNAGTANTSIQFLKNGVKHAGMVYDGSQIVFKGLSSSNDFNPDLALQGSAPEFVNVKFIGNVAIGNNINNLKYPQGYMLAVGGNIISESVEVRLQSAWPDYVFDEKYEVPSLKDLEAYIRVNRHLPGVPSAAEVKDNGINLGEMDAVLLKKIEELTLYVIQQQQEIEKLKAQVNK